MLMILDGFGLNPTARGNAIAAADTPHLSKHAEKPWDCPKARWEIPRWAT